MAKYQNQYREELEGDETTYSEDLAQEQGGSANPANEEDTFKKDTVICVGICSRLSTNINSRSMNYKVS